MGSASVKVVSGTTIGPYVVERKLAQGGMSVLFLAHDTQLDRSVALKMLAEDATSQATRLRLLREARTLAAVDHPGIVRIYGAGEHDGYPWIAMELVRGTDLKRVLAERGAVSAARALKWVMQAAEALVAAHDVGVVHRDLKPSNLLLTHEDRIKIVDFGIAKRRVDPAGDVITSQGEVLGTPAYLSPEQLEHGLADERSDVWGLGCVLFELCVGSPPFGRASVAATTASILRDEPVFPATLSSAVVDVIHACLRKSSFARIASMTELNAVLRAALDDVQRSGAGSSMRPPGDPGSGVTRASSRTSVAPQTTTSASVAPSSVSSISSTPPRATDSPPRLSDPPPRLSRPVTPFTPFRASSVPASASGAKTHPRGHMKGTAVRTGVVWCAQRYGADVVARAVARTPSAKDMIRLDDPSYGIVASGWYETKTVGELLLALEDVAGVDDRDAYYNSLADAIARDNVGGVYRSLFRLITTPSTLEANAQRVWRTYCDEGTFLVRAPRNGELVLEIRHWTHHHPATCTLVGYAIQHVLRQVGYEALVVERTQCLSQGDPMCAFEGIYLVK